MTEARILAGLKVQPEIRGTAKHPEIKRSSKALCR